MGFLSKLLNYGAGEGPEPRILDPVLGELNWSKDAEGWQGSYNGFQFSIAYDRTPVPDDGLLAYVRESLNNPDWLNSSLAEAKEKYKCECRPKDREFYSAEIDELTWESLYFARYSGGGKRGGKLFILASLEPGRDFRAWRIEFFEHTCEGLGFDS
jgi:hypothetical protein